MSAGWWRRQSGRCKWIDQYLNEAHSYGLTSVRAHFNVMAWSDDAEELKHIKNDVGSQLASMECVPRHNTIDCPTLYWAAMPGNAADFPAEESFHTFIEQAVCLFTEETNYRSSLSPFGIKMVDRLTGKPLHLDISDLPMKRGITTNRNKFVLGPSGSGKSFFMNHLVRQYYEQGTHVVLVDTGNSYQGLCEMIRRKTNGADGVYFTYTEEKPISFNPFYTDDYVFDVEKKDSIKTLLLTLWKSEDDKVTKTESGELGSAVNAYIERIRADRSIVPSFNTFYEYMRDDNFTVEELGAIAFGYTKLLEESNDVLTELRNVVNITTLSMMMMVTTGKSSRFSLILSISKTMNRLPSRSMFSVELSRKS
jgi:conjugation system TraG family ATPase